MPDYIVYDVNGRITEKFLSVPLSVVEGKNNLLQIPRSIFNNLTKYHKVSGGEVVEMTADEKNALDAELAQAAENELIAQINALQVSVNDAFSAFLTVFNSKFSTPNNITKAEVIAQIKTDKGLS